MLVYWLKKGLVSVLEVEEVMGDTSVGSEGEVKLSRTFHTVIIAAVGIHICINSTCVCVKQGRDEKTQEDYPTSVKIR